VVDGPLLGTVAKIMTSSMYSTPRRLRVGAASVVAALALGACGSDSVSVPKDGTGNAYTDAVIESDSHDEVVFPAGGDMVVAVNCSPAAGGGPLVTAVADGLAAGTYVGTFDPTTGTDLTLDVSGAQTVATAQMTLDKPEYTVTFADIDGAVFTVRGC
jgi:hypothetical protein